MDNLTPALRSARTDGNFPIPRAETSLEFTGERLTGAVDGQIEFEHYHRYCLARDLCDGRDVVDVASGEGYGSALLAGVARSVVGIEIDAGATAHAAASYRLHNLRFLQGDALALPLTDASADIVVSFETLEHLPDHAMFIAEVRRVLRPGGLFIVSTPDRAVYSAPGSDPNPYHVLELTDPEFRALLKSHFAQVRVLAQRPVLGSLLAAEDSAAWRSYERRGADIIEATGGLARAHYLIGVATDGSLPEIPSSAYLDRHRVHDVVQAAQRLPVVEAESAALTQRLDALGRRLDEIVAERDQARADSARFEASWTAAQDSLRAAEHDLAQALSRHAAEAAATASAQEHLHAAELAHAAAEARVDDLIREHASVAQEAGRLSAQAEATQQEARLATELLTVAQARQSEAETARQAAEKQAAAATRSVAELRAALEAAQAKFAAALAAKELADGHRLAAEAAAAEAARAADAVIYSTTWRALAPLRAVGGRFPRLARALGRLVRVVWWVITLQIGHRYLMWRLYRPQRQAAAAAARATVAPPAQPPVVALAPPAPPAEPVAERRPPPPATPAPAAPARSLRAAFQAWHGTGPIHFPPVEAPEVSVIIPAYRGLADLQTCLRSLTLHRATEPSFEVILLDDCPAEKVLWAIPDSGGLIKIANAQNLGFLLTCNRGATAARGRYLCFLNSDTIVSAGWLRALIEALNEVPGAALAGGMLIGDDGTIQEAGWRIMSDGWGHPIGRGGDPKDGAYTYRRPVDCVTGACFATPRAVFEQLGGFDTAYAPAFYEEFDLAFRARAQGFLVIYEPRSTVVHLGSASYGAERRDQLSRINHATFVTRFAAGLPKHPWDKSDEFALRHAAGEGPVLLVIDDGVPQPDRHAGGLTMSGYLALLATAGWRVVFGPFNGQADGPAAEALERQGIELIRTPSSLEAWLNAHGAHVREVWLARPDIAERMIPLLRATTTARIAYYTHDLHHVRLQREAELHDDAEARTKAARLARLETWIFQNVDHVTAPSAEEAAVIRRLAPTRPVTVLPPYHYEAVDITTHDAAHFETLSDVVFVGGFPHIPNVDAALFMAREVMPLVWQARPDARLVLVGYAPPPEIQALAGPRIVVTGQVPRIEPFMGRARCLLAGLRYGAGVKGKTVEALRLGVPVVTTPVGAEGVGIEPGQDALVAEDAAGLAAGVLALFDDPALCAALSAHGADLVRRRFSRAAARSAIGAVFTTRRCGVCGSGRVETPPLDGNFRESFVCRNCFALGRAEALGRVAVARLERDGETSLAELARRRCDLRIHEFGFVGGVADTLRGQPWYSMSEFFDGVTPGEIGPHSVRCEDITRLTFGDETFDTLISQDVMEHVPDPVRGFAESARVLRPGGSHIFTIPQDLRLERSVTRARLTDSGVEHILPPDYHGDPMRAEGALVFTDFGADLGSLVAQAGLQLIEHDIPVVGGTFAEAIRVFEAIKPLPDGSVPARLLLTSLDDPLSGEETETPEGFEPLIEFGAPVRMAFRNRQVQANSHLSSGYVYFDPPPLDQLNAYYQSEYTLSQTSYYSTETDYAEDKNAYHADRIVTLYESIMQRTPRNSFELGCAYGGLVAEMARRGIDARGSDINADAIGKGASTQDNQFIFQASNRDALKQFTGTVELIYSLHVLEHDPDMFGVIAACRDRLSEDGLLFISVPNAMFANAVLNGFKHNPWVNYPQHLHMLSAGFIPELCRRTGFMPLFWDTHILFEAEPRMAEMFNPGRQTETQRETWSLVLGDGGFGMELNFALVPDTPANAIRFADRAREAAGSLRREAKRETGIRRLLKSAKR